MIVYLKPEEANRRLLFCNNLRDIVRNGPIGAVELAKRTGLSVTTVYNYMKGRTFPSDEHIKILADGLEVTVEDLFDDTYTPWAFGPIYGN